jgi:hypothetical protein
MLKVSSEMGDSAVDTCQRCWYWVLEEANVYLLFNRRLRSVWNKKKKELTIIYIPAVNKSC